MKDDAQLLTDALNNAIHDALSSRVYMIKGQPLHLVDALHEIAVALNQLVEVQMAPKIRTPLSRPDEDEE